jgi:uncharacterized protein
MSERDGYQPGVPSWVDILGPDSRQLRDFYGAIFGWEFAGPGEMPGDPPGEYYVARLRGRDVAGVGSAPANGQAEPAWNTYIEVESVERTGSAIAEAGGTVLVEPFDAPPAGRIAVAADPAGAAFCVWEPGERKGAQLVNEPGAWSMSALNAPDPAAAAAFYRAVFGWETDSFGLGEMEVTLFRRPGYVGGNPEQPVPRDVVATMAPAGGEPGGARWSVDFWVGDMDAVLGKATALGGGVVVPPYELPMMRQAVLADPGGAAFSVTQLMLPG